MKRITTMAQDFAIALVLLVLIIIVLFGCSNNTFDKAVERNKETVLVVNESLGAIVVRAEGRRTSVYPQTPRCIELRTSGNVRMAVREMGSSQWFYSPVFSTQESWGWTLYNDLRTSRINLIPRGRCNER